MIKFTIVTCTFNAEHELQRTLDSVFHQSYADVEHLILDGLSHDRSVEMAQTYKQRSDEARTGHEVVVCSERDSGLYDAMNKGIAKATGDYIVFLNAGDTFPSEATLEHIAHSIGDGEALPGVIYGDTDIVNDEGRFLRHRRLQPPAKLTWRSFRNGMLVCHQAFYALTTLAKDNPYNLNYRFSADVDWCIRVMKEAERQHLMLKNVDEVVVNYLDGGMTEKNHRASLRERFSVMRRHYGLPLTLIMHVWFVVRQLKK
ncbi:MAG: glycosyltransferase [Prevotella sp.]|nr:glycosyltransferase [Prevotella sp.]